MTNKKTGAYILSPDTYPVVKIMLNKTLINDEQILPQSIEVEIDVSKVVESAPNEMVSIERLVEAWLSNPK
ncbi:MAG: hypothetical protein IZT57_03910 [Chloroflexi bacterium]|nr:hypothetical protein [Chloroflexota bacterium]